MEAAVVELKAAVVEWRPRWWRGGRGGGVEAAVVELKAAVVAWRPRWWRGGRGGGVEAAVVAWRPRWWRGGRGGGVEAAVVELKAAVVEWRPRWWSGGRGGGVEGRGGGVKAAVVELKAAVVEWRPRWWRGGRGGGLPPRLSASCRINNRPDGSTAPRESLDCAIYPQFLYSIDHRTLCWRRSRKSVICSYALDVVHITAHAARILLQTNTLRHFLQYLYSHCGRLQTPHAKKICFCHS